MHDEIRTARPETAVLGQLVVGMLAPGRKHDTVGPSLALRHRMTVDKPFLLHVETLIIDDLGSVEEIHLPEHDLVELRLPPVKVRATELAGVDDHELVAEPSELSPLHPALGKPLNGRLVESLENREGFVGFAGPYSVDEGLILVLAKDQAGVVVDHVILDRVAAGDRQRGAFRDPGIVFLAGNVVPGCHGIFLLLKFLTVVAVE